MGFPPFDTLASEIDRQQEHWSVPKMQSWIQQHYALTIPLSTIEYYHPQLKNHTNHAIPLLFDPLVSTQLLHALCILHPLHQ